MICRIPVYKLMSQSQLHIHHSCQSKEGVTAEKAESQAV